ncbi:hypothetical protein [Salinarchaeum laminariae]|uniref:hypothetical protein n=1 Tax=Salinarchaeum laminariae TaxID=869888 RepID=UPI0020BDDDEB|nr:hypothetical protein [Salinarchaeum laminariae]
MVRTTHSRRRILQASGVAIATALAGCGGGGSSDEDESTDADVTVTLGGDPSYDPQTVEITVGQTVAWEAAKGNHFLSLQSGPEESDWAGTGASAIAADQVHTHTFEVAGTYEYSSNSLSGTGSVVVSE